MAPKKFWRLDPSSVVEWTSTEGGTVVNEPKPLIGSIKPGHGIVLAEWDDASQLGVTKRLGIVKAVRADSSAADIVWKDADNKFRPSASGRRFWKQEKPFFGFAPDVVANYMLAAIFAECFPEYAEMSFGASPRPAANTPRPSSSPTGGYVYVVKSPHGYKIGKSVNVRSRTRLFGVVLPFPISVEHYAWFEDYTHAERNFHQIFHAKRLEGEWFNLDVDDLARIKSMGEIVQVPGM